MSENNAYPPELKALNAAIAKAQGEFPPIPKDKTAKAGTYSYDYADLASILALVRPVLSKHGLALVQRLENPSGGGPSIRTELRHADGGVIAASFPLGEWQTMQQLGSSATYVRRYALCGMLGIAAEEDDDAQSVAPVPVAATGAGASPRPDTAVTETPQFKAPVADDLDARQRRRIFAIKTKLTKAGVFNEEEWKGQLLLSFGVDSVTGLTSEQAEQLIERLLVAEKKLEQEKEAKA